VLSVVAVGGWKGALLYFRAVPLKVVDLMPMVFKSIRDSVSASAPTWPFSMSAFYVTQGHPVHIPRRH
jgi:hypothetical protein